MEHSSGVPWNWNVTNLVLSTSGKVGEGEGEGGGGAGGRKLGEGQKNFY